MFLFALPKVIKLNINRRSKSYFQAVTNNNDGLTVVELMIAVAILVLVLAGGYTFFSFGWNTFDRGTSKAIVQNNLRMAVEDITKEIRYAGNLSIIDSTGVPDPIENDDFYIFVNNDNRIERKSKTDMKIIPHELDSDINFELSFVRVEENRLKIVVKESGSDMEIETEIRLLNGTIDNTITSGNALRVESNVSGGNPDPVAVTGVTLSDSNLTLQEGNSLTLIALVQPPGDTNKNVTWISNNTTVATVNSNGLVTGISAGTATITVTTEDGSFTDTCAITVVETQALSINNVNPPMAKVDSVYNHSFSATGGVEPYTFSLVSGNLPNGINLSIGGILSGAPAANTDDTYYITINVTDNSDPVNSDSHEFTLVVNPGTGGDPVNVATESNKFSSTPVNTAIGNLSVESGFANWNSLPVSVQYDLGEGNEVVVVSYTLKAEMSGRAPKEWTMQGSADGLTWDDLSTVTLAPSPNPWVSQNTHTYDLPEEKRGSYRYYRLNITTAYHNNQLRLNQVQLLVTP